MSVEKLDRPYLTPMEIAQILHISYTTTMRLIKADRIKGAVRMPYGWRIPTSSVKEFIEMNGQKSGKNKTLGCDTG